MEIDRTLLNFDEQAVFALRSLYGRFGYTRYKMSRFEEYDLYVRNKDFLVSDQVITFTDRTGRLLAMKPDVTLSIIKNAPDEAGAVQKVFYNENVYRVTDDSHTFREIMQTGLECIGDLNRYHIAEGGLLAAKSLALISPRFVLDISHMGLISAALSASGLSPAGQNAALSFLRQKNAHELTTLCQSEGADGSLLSALVDGCGQAGSVLPALKARMDTPELEDAWEQLDTLCRMLDRAGFGSQIRVDFSVGNDLKYYSGVVFKGYLEGIPASVLSGGQYDALLKKMHRDSSAIGFAIYTDLLQRLENAENDYDVDTVLLHDAEEDPAALAEAAQILSETCSILVTDRRPADKKYRVLAQFRDGEVRILENHG